MKDIVAFTLLVAIILSLLLCAYSCSDKAAVNVTNGSAAPSVITGSKDHASTPTPSTSIITEIDYESCIPEVPFGDKVIAFKDNNGKTFLYANVTYADIKAYIIALELMGYSCNATEKNSEEDDIFIATYSNKKNGATVSINYQEAGLSIKVVLDY